MTREMWEGNQAIAEAAVRAGLEAYFGYPITPQTEALEYLSKRMPDLGRTFVQAESAKYVQVIKDTGAKPE